MKVFFFHLMPWPHLPYDFDEKYDSAWVWCPNSLFDPDWKEEEKPWVVGRKPFGKIAIANSDAGASAYTDVAIDQAWRAVVELRRG